MVYAPIVQSNNYFLDLGYTIMSRLRQAVPRRNSLIDTIPQLEARINTDATNMEIDFDKLAPEAWYTTAVHSDRSSYGWSNTRKSLNHPKDLLPFFYC